MIDEMTRKEKLKTLFFSELMWDFCEWCNGQSDVRKLLKLRKTDNVRAGDVVEKFIIQKADFVTNTTTKARNQSLAKSIGDVFVAFETSGIKIREWEAKFSELEEEFRKVA